MCSSCEGMPADNLVISINVYVLTQEQAVLRWPLNHTTPRASNSQSIDLKG